MAPSTHRRTAVTAWKQSGSVWKPKVTPSALIGMACVVAATPPLDEKEKDEELVYADEEGSVGDGGSTRATVDESDGERTECEDPLRENASFSSDAEASSPEASASPPPAPVSCARETMLRMRAGLAARGELAPPPAGGCLRAESCPQKAKATTSISTPVSSPSARAKAAAPPAADLSWAASWEDEDGQRERSIRSILNKLTPEKFDRLYPQLLACGAGFREHCAALADEIFEKAALQHGFAAMYADLCVRLVANDEKEGHGAELRGEFLRLWRGHVEGSLLPPPDGGGEGDEEARVLSRKRTSGGFRFGGELLARGLVPSAELLLCAQDLVKPPLASEKLEACAVILTVTGPTFDQDSWARHGELKELFAGVERLSDDPAVPSRARYLLRDLLDLRAASWVDGKVATQAQGPKKLVEVKRGDAAPRSPQAAIWAQGPVWTEVPSAVEAPVAARPKPANVRTCADILGMGMGALQHQVHQANDSAHVHQYGTSDNGAKAMWQMPMQYMPMVWVPMGYMQTSCAQSPAASSPGFLAEQAPARKKTTRLVNRRV